MRPSIALDLKRRAIHEATSRFRPTNPRIIESVLHGLNFERKFVESAMLKLLRNSGPSTD